MNFILEEFRQVDWLVIKIKQVPFLLISCSSLFQWRGSSSELPYSALNLVKPQNFAFALSKPLAFCRAYFLRIQLGKHQNSLLLFRRLIFSTSVLAFSHRTLIHSTQFLLFQQQISFPMHAFAEGYNATLRSIF